MDELKDGVIPENAEEAADAAGNAAVQAAETAAEAAEQAYQAADDAAQRVQSAAAPGQYQGWDQNTAAGSQNFVQPPAPAPKKKSGGLKFAVIGMLAVLFIIILIIVLASGNPAININEYTTVTFDGYEGYGLPTVKIDYDKIRTDYGEKVKVDLGRNKDLGELGGLASVFSSMYTVADAAKDCIKYEVTPREGLKNGDEVTVKFTIDEENFSKLCKAKLKAEDMVVKAEGLTSIKTYDPLDAEYLTIEYEGYSGEARIILNSTNKSPVKNIRYSVSRSDLLSNGDEITISCNSNGDLEQNSLKYGYMPKRDKMTVTVSGLAEYKDADLFTDLKVSFEGVDRYGTVSIDPSALGYDHIVFYADRTENLTNGDEVTVTARSDDSWYSVADMLKKQGYIVDETSKKYTVSGLEELDEYDPFTDVEVVYDGISGYATANIETGSSKEVQYFSFRIDGNSDLSNGDEIVITPSMSGSEKEFIDKFSLQPGLEPKTFTVEGLSHYFTDGDKLDDDFLKKAKSQAEDIISSVSRTNTKSEDIKYIGNIILMNKKESNASDNFAYLVYEVKASFLSDKKDTFTSYTAVGYKHIVVDTDGKCDTDILDYDNVWSYKSYTYEHTAEDKNGYEQDSWTLNGFGSLEDLKDYLITGNREYYFYEDNVETKAK